MENGIQLKVQGINQNRIVKVLMTLPEKTDETEEETSTTTEETDLDTVTLIFAAASRSAHARWQAIRIPMTRIAALKDLTMAMVIM